MSSTAIPERYDPMKKKKTILSIKGDSPEKKLEQLDIIKNQESDIRNLRRIHGTYSDLEIYLLFEKDLADKKIEKIFSKYANVPEYERPYISVENFIKYGSENDPTFTQRLKEFPLTVRVVTIGTYTDSRTSSTRYYVFALLPFLEDIDFESREEVWEKEGIELIE